MPNSLRRLGPTLVVACLIAGACGSNSVGETPASPVATATVVPEVDPAPTPIEQAPEELAPSAPPVSPDAGVVAATPPVDEPGPVNEVTAAGRREGIEVYSGLGAWLDVFDYSPAYGFDGVPAVGPEVVDDMAAAGVTTLYLQTARRDGLSSGLTEDPAVIAAFLKRAHDNDMAVVGWYLPTWTGLRRGDLDRLVAILDFEVDGQRFDGVAVDIEGVPVQAQRRDWNRRLFVLSEDLRAAAGDRAIGAIVLPPVLIEDINDQYWPEFPWREISPFYDVWMPMTYWSFRSSDSPWADPAKYTADSVVRLRENIDDPLAIVHPIGGIGATDDETLGSEPLAAVDDLGSFVFAVDATDSVGWSVYDWMTMSPDGRERMRDLAG